MPAVRLEVAGEQHRHALLAAVTRSLQLHGRWVHAPRDEHEFDVWLTRLELGRSRAFIVIDPVEACPAGVTTMSEITRGTLESAYLSYYALQPYAGRGYLYEGVRQTIRYAFGSLRLHRLEANIQPANQPSKALVQRLGFRLEGYSPRYLKINGRWRDHERWAVLREEFKAGALPDAPP
ncbi:MAG: GNAT family N-acetyltransferase [Pseudomonadota bacterium]